MTDLRIVMSWSNGIEKFWEVLRSCGFVRYQEQLVAVG